MYLDTLQQHTFEIEDFIGERIAVLGISGSGKTNTVAVIIESLIEHIPMTIIDIEGEYWGLKAQYNIIIAGNSEQSDIPLTEGNAATLARWSYDNRISVVLDLSETHEDEMFYIVENYLNALWIASKKKQPYMLVVEECHEFMPQKGTTPAKDLITRIAKRGRKHGFGIIMSSQRSSSVDKNVLTQAGMFFLHKVNHPTDMNVYKDLIPLKPIEVNAKVRALKTGQAILVRDHQPRMIQIKQRATFHAGYTPGLDDNEVPVLRTLSPELLQKLQQLMKTSEGTPRDETKALQAKLDMQNEQITELKATIAKQAKEIQTLCTQIESLSQPIQASLPLVIDEDAKEERIEANKKRAMSRQRSNFNRIIRQLQGLDKNHLTILGFLLDNPDRSFTLEDIATHTGYSVSRATVPILLDKLGLTRREKKGRYSFYQASAEDTLQSICPDLDSFILLEEIHALSK